MASLNELAYNVLNIARGGLSSDDDRLNIRQIKFWIRYYRSYAILNFSQSGKKIDFQLVQDLGCITLEDVDKADCPSVLWGCNVKKAAIPKLVDLPNDKGLIWVGLVDKQTPIIITSPNVVHFKKHQRFTGDMRRAYFIGGNIYVTDPFNEDICYINVRGIFDDPKDVCYTTSDGNSTYIDDDDDYPLPNYMIPFIIENILEKELNVSINSINDETNDARTPNTPIDDRKEA
jgi:hypothetical protein